MVERSSPFAATVQGRADGVTLAPMARGSLWQVAAWGDTYAEVEAALAKACGCEAPAPNLAVATKDGGQLIRTEPLKWWVLGADGADCPLQPDPADGAWLDLGHDQAGVTLSGPNAAELLKRMVSIDVREAAFPNGAFATTDMHHMITRVLRLDADGPCYHVMVMRSYADVLREVASHHLAHFG
ncbi:MAG: hypothetical protein AAF674_17860 [Pseudomonadota bacterium]